MKSNRLFAFSILIIVALGLYRVFNQLFGIHRPDSVAVTIPITLEYSLYFGTLIFAIFYIQKYWISAIFCYTSSIFLSKLKTYIARGLHNILGIDFISMERILTVFEGIILLVSMSLIIKFLTLKNPPEMLGVLRDRKRLIDK